MRTLALSTWASRGEACSVATDAILPPGFAVPDCAWLHRPAMVHAAVIEVYRLRDRLQGWP
jgi:hypothetical protein